MGTKFLVLISTGLIFSAAVFADTAPCNFDDYMVNVREKIQKSWTPPEVLEEGHAVIVFKLNRNGDVISSYLKESSGNVLYDESATTALSKAAPFDEFPEGARKEYITILYSFDSSIVSTDRVKELVQISETYINSDNEKARKYIDLAIKEIEGDPAAYFLYARRHKIDQMMGDLNAAYDDMAKCKALKAAYDRRRINTCKMALQKEETPFGYFNLANAYDLAGDYTNAIASIDKAISLTDLNQGYKRYRAEMVSKMSKKQ